MRSKSEHIYPIQLSLLLVYYTHNFKYTLTSEFEIGEGEPKATATVDPMEIRGRNRGTSYKHQFPALIRATIEDHDISASAAKASLASAEETFSSGIFAFSECLGGAFSGCERLAFARCIRVVPAMI